MHNFTAPVDIFNTTADITTTTTADIFNSTINYITPQLPETPLHQEVSGNLGPFFYVSMIIIGAWLFFIFM